MHQNLPLQFDDKAVFEVHVYCVLLQVHQEKANNQTCPKNSQQEVIDEKLFLYILKVLIYPLLCEQKAANKREPAEDPCL